MTVGELIERLKRWDPDAKVRFSYSCGDYGNTQAASEVDEVRAGLVRDNAYIGDYELVDVGDSLDDFSKCEDGDERAVVLL